MHSRSVCTSIAVRARNMAMRDLSLQLRAFQRHRLLHVDESNKKERHMWNGWVPWI